MQLKGLLISGIVIMIAGLVWTFVTPDVVRGCGHSRFKSTADVERQLIETCENSLQFADAKGRVSSCKGKVSKLREQTLFDTYVYTYTLDKTFEGLLPTTVQKTGHDTGIIVSHEQGVADACVTTKLVAHSQTITPDL